MLEIQNGQKVLVIRYGTNIVADCIDKHKEVIKNNGFCWFGKIGTAPSDKVIKSVFEEDAPVIILYSKGVAHIAELEDITKDKPVGGYPGYYNEYLYDKQLYPKIYFKLKTIEPMDINELSQYRIASSGNTLLFTLNSSMSSFFLAEHGKGTIGTTKKNSVPSVKDKKQPVSNRECKYQEDGYCNNKRCINYQYECIHPDVCLKRTV